VSSIAGLIGQPFCDAYCAAKHALEGLTKSPHPVAATSGVNVSLIEPGPFESEFDAHDVDAAAAGDDLAELRAR
jgi:NAD(P)-dependent dehydrogenase (short-subunit alcohol dehydrogenase family)